MSGVPILTQGRRRPERAEVQLGNISGNVVIDVSAGAYFKGTLVGNVSISFIGGPAPAVTLDLTMGGAGSFSLGWSNDGLDVVDPAGLSQVIAAAPGSRSIGLWSASRTEVFALGYNASP
jgi:hypothetical protein